MADREDNVYQAKLAEQAERYDGKFLFLMHWKPIPYRIVQIPKIFSGSKMICCLTFTTYL